MLYLIKMQYLSRINLLRDDDLSLMYVIFIPTFFIHSTHVLSHNFLFFIITFFKLNFSNLEMIFVHNLSRHKNNIFCNKKINQSFQDRNGILFNSKIGRISIYVCNSKFII